MRNPGLRYWTNKARSVATVGICYGVGGGVVSLRRVQGWEDTRILLPFSDWRLVRVSLGLELIRLDFFLHLHALSIYLAYTTYVASRCSGLRRVLLRQRTLSASSLLLLLYETLEVGEARDEGLWFAVYGTRAFIKNIMRKVETINKKILRSFWWIIYVGIVVSRRNARTTD